MLYCVICRNARTYQCKFCERTFCLSINLKKHLWLSHPRIRVLTEQQKSNLSTEQPKMSNQERLKDKLAKAVLGSLSTTAAKEVSYEWRQKNFTLFWSFSLTSSRNNLFGIICVTSFMRSACLLFWKKNILKHTPGTFIVGSRGASQLGGIF